MAGILFLIGGIVLLVGAIAAISVFIYFKVKLRRLLDDAGYQGRADQMHYRQRHLPARPQLSGCREAAA